MINMASQMYDFTSCIGYEFWTHYNTRPRDWHIDKDEQLKMKTGQMMRGLGMSEPTDEELKRLEDEFMEEIEDLNNEDKPKRTIH